MSTTTLEPAVSVKTHEAPGADRQETLWGIIETSLAGLLPDFSPERRGIIAIRIAEGILDAEHNARVRARVQSSSALALRSPGERGAA